MWLQKEILLEPKRRGFHLITREVVSKLPELKRFEVGLAHFFLCHTSASLTLNENADPSVRADMEAHASRMVPDGAPYFSHTLEGPDDMPAHIKSSLFGVSLTVPIRSGRLRLGTWQGLYLNEHREEGGPRRLVVTLHGKVRDEKAG